MTIKTPSFELAAYIKGNPEATKLAIVNPGRLDTKDYIHMTSLVDYLANKGYLALSFDPPGTWESPGGIELYSTTNVCKAIDEIIEYYGNRPTIVVGHSRGGTHALLAGTTNPHVTHYAAIMSHHGPTAIGLPKQGEAVSVSHRDLPPGTARTTEQKEFTLPVKYFTDQAQYDALSDLKVSKKPKLFIYGQRDELVSAESVYDMYNQSSEPKMIHGVDVEHDYRLHPQAILEVNQTVGTFLDTNF